MMDVDARDFVGGGLGLGDALDALDDGFLALLDVAVRSSEAAAVCDKKPVFLTRVDPGLAEKLKKLNTACGALTHAAFGVDVRQHLNGHEKVVVNIHTTEADSNMLDNLHAARDTSVFAYLQALTAVGYVSRSITHHRDKRDHKLYAAINVLRNTRDPCLSHRRRRVLEFLASLCDILSPTKSFFFLRAGATFSAHEMMKKRIERISCARH